VENKGRLGPHPSSPVPAALSRARRGLLELLQAEGPRTLAALAARSGLHENTVRGHLEGLAADGLVTREQEAPQGRGRPAWRWAARSGASQEYAGLATALARTLRRTSARPEEDALGAGRDWGHGLATGLATGRGVGSVGAVAGPGDASAAVRLRGLLDHLGFDPEGEAERGELRLTGCPLLEAALEEPEIVCNVHRGLVAGALAEYGDPDPDVELLPFAEPGACVLRWAVHP
jgi:predicted ArsR family transcriptional regulator